MTSTLSAASGSRVASAWTSGWAPAVRAAASIPADRSTPDDLDTRQVGAGAAQTGGVPPGSATGVDDHLAGAQPALQGGLDLAARPAAGPAVVTDRESLVVVR